MDEPCRPQKTIRFDAATAAAQPDWSSRSRPVLQRRGRDGRSDAPASSWPGSRHDDPSAQAQAVGPLRRTSAADHLKERVRSATKRDSHWMSFSISPARPPVAAGFLLLLDWAGWLLVR